MDTAIHVIVKKLYDLSSYLNDLTLNKTDDIPLLTLSRADEKAPEGWSIRNDISRIKEKTENLFPEARNFK